MRMSPQELPRLDFAENPSLEVRCSNVIEEAWCRDVAEHAPMQRSKEGCTSGPLSWVVYPFGVV